MNEFPLVLIERCGLREAGVGDRDLGDVVQLGRLADLLDMMGRQRARSSAVAEARAAMS
jgi:hypothetical protein